MQRLLIPFVFLIALGPRIAAQIIGVELKPEAQGDFSKWLLEKKGRLLICGDPSEGFELNADKVMATRPGVKRIVIGVPDPAKPGAPIDKERKVSIDVNKIKGYETVLQFETCEGLRLDYLRKKERLDAAKKRVAAAKPNSSEWFAGNRNLLTEIDTLAVWLRSTFFPAAAKTVENEYGAEAKKQGIVAAKSRLDTAKKVTPLAVPPSLDQKTKEYGGGDAKWHGRQTQHLSVIAHGAFTDSVLDGALQFGERIIDGYRTKFIDPYLGPEESDPIPEGITSEYVLVPDDKVLAAKLYEGWLGRSFDKAHREKSMEMQGHRGRSGLAFHEYYRFSTKDDFEGAVAHTIGHHLASMHFGRSGTVPAWINEGFAYWVSFEFLSRNSVTCFAWSVPPGYAREGQKEGTKVAELGLRAMFNDVALKKGPPFSSLIRMTLTEMSSSEFAKSWSVVDFLLTTQKPKLARLLREACAASDNDGRTQIERFRKPCEELYPPDPGRDVFADIEELWKAYALSIQKGGGKK